VEEIFKKIGEEVLEERQRYGRRRIVFETLAVVLVDIFVCVVELEQAISTDDPIEIRAAFGRLVGLTVLTLTSLDRGWCLRSPAHQRGRYESPAALTKDLRMRMWVAVAYWHKYDARDTTMALELVLKSALQLASKLDFDVLMTLQAQRPAIVTW